MEVSDHRDVWWEASLQIISMTSVEQSPQHQMLYTALAQFAGVMAQTYAKKAAEDKG